MNPFTFNNPEVRAIALDLAKSLADFDTKATAALEACEKRIAALETKEGHHEKVITTPADLSTRVTPLRKSSHVLTAADRKVIAALDALKPVACVPGFQDVDSEAPNYFKALSGRIS